MSEPSAIAEGVEEVVPGVWHWRLHDERIDFVSAAHAVSDDDKVVLVDPLPLERSELGRLGDVGAIVLSAGSHQRSTWRLRRELGVEVWAPELSREIDEEPDVRYRDGDILPGGLRAIFTPGAGTTQHTLLLDRGDGIAFVPDLLLRAEGGEVELCPAKYMHDPEQGRRSVERLLDLPFSVLCLSHGAPVVHGPKDAIRAALIG